MKIKSIKKIKTWSGKKVLLRLDLNVPLNKGQIEDDFKIRASLATINYLLKRKAKLIIISHLGRPNKKFDQQYSLQLVADHLQLLLGQEIALVKDIDQAKKHRWSDNQILMLENLRFFKEEIDNSAAFAKRLASLANLYINDALAVSHRRQASVCRIKSYLPSYAGLLLEKELINFNKILKPEQPLIILMGGIKVSTKSALLKNLEKKADKILLGGGLANTFLHFQGYQIGQSVYEKKAKKFISPLIQSDKIVLPLDLLVKTRTGQIVLRKPGEIRKTEAIYDIGPNTIIEYCRNLKTANTIIWNGPMGKFEEKSFKHGTLSMAIMIASLANSAFSLVGGGETLAALKISKLDSYINWVSTGGGAMLSYLGGDSMPGLEKIVN